MHLFSSFVFASRLPQAIEVHRCCCPGGLLGGLGAGRGRLGGILEREREREIVGLVVLHLFPLFAFASGSPQALEVHYCRCRGGLGARRGGFGGHICRRVLFLFSSLCLFTVVVVGDKAFAILAGWGVVTNS